MSTAEKIFAEVASLSSERQTEVLDFVGYLRTREAAMEDAAFRNLSLSRAMRGMEDEPDLYDISDIKEPVQ